MKKQLPKRHELEVKHTWDMSNLFKDETLYLETFDQVEQDVAIFASTYEGRLLNETMINEALLSYQDIQGRLSRISAYGSLQTSTDSLSEENQIRQGNAMMRFQTISKKMSFFNNELKKCSDDVLQKASRLNVANQYYLEDIIRDKKHALSPEVEKALVSLSPVLNNAYQNYNRFKLADMKFSDFSVEGVDYPNSFTLFENEYEYDENTKVRRKAYETFYQKLSEYQHGFASNYQAHLQKEKIMSELRGFNSVFDYLLYDQKV